MKRNQPIQISIHRPTTEAGRQELAKLTARVHADFVRAAINRQDCSSAQKQALLQAVLTPDD